MMSELKENIIRIIVFVAAVIACYFAITLFQKKPKEDKYFEMVLALKDTINAGLIRERNAAIKHAEEKISLLMQKDTVLIREYKTNTVRYANIPNVVNNLNDAELARAVEEFR